MNSLLIFLVVALVAAAIGFTWALMERGRANRAEARAWALQDSASRLKLIEEQGGRNAALIQAEAVTAIADQVLKRADETFKGREELAQAKLAAQLKPVADTLERFQKHVAEVEQKRVEETGGLKAQIANLLTAANAGHEETRKLTNALKRGAGIQGRWGEQMLRNVLEMAGLKFGVDFEEQVHTVNEDGAARPDVVVKLPGGSFLVIDAKVSLSDYETYLSAQDEVTRDAALAAHAESVRRHVRQLSSKAYWTRFDRPPFSRSPDVVVMFVPLESAFACAIEHHTSLVADAWEQRVAIVTPAALFPLLKAVAYGWRAEDQAANAREIADAGRELHKRVSVIAKYAADLGTSLDRAVNHYNDFVGSLERNVMTQAKKFEALSAQSDKIIADTPTLDSRARPLVKLVAPDEDETPVLTLKGG
ncbi:DNA recombination protein RmuC [Phenylobacterium sp.]|uniref:DNA recombination protein RmuC n=1 Tax=Phenylobacterium sp. TaxID=1871053 RepID=UPI0030F4246E